MELFIKVAGTKIKCMATVKKFGQMEINFKANIKMERRVDMANFNMRTEVFVRENIQKISLMGMEEL